MATKKQKRLEAQVKREKFLAEIKEEGLRAQALDRQYQEAEAAEIQAWASSYNARAERIIREARH